ncbi:MAG: TIGR03364 family FAD-dependent oxidoreductase [Parvularculaceae bacterium]
MNFDLAVVGAGIVGLAHALAGVRRGLRVVVIDREARPVGASIRNFGFVTVTGQGCGETWRRARRSAQVWTEVAPLAGIVIEHRGLVVVAQRPEALSVLEAFRATEMGEGCDLLSAADARNRFQELRPRCLAGALWSPHDLRVESRTAIPKLVDWLASQGVVFQFSSAVRAINDGLVETARGDVHAATVVVCPGDDMATLYPDIISQHQVSRCVLQMLRLEPPGFRLPGSVMSDLSLVRYAGYAALPESAALRARLDKEQSAHLANGVHLIIVQGADGSLVVGDSHHYGAATDPFAARAVEDLILEECEAILGVCPTVRERWTGTYASSPLGDMFRASPEDNVRLVVVTSGTGASTAFAIGEETLEDLSGPVTQRQLA